MSPSGAGRLDMDLFFRQYGERLRADVARRVSASVDVEAVVQDAVLRALADLSRFDSERALYRYCRATALDLARPRWGFRRWESPHANPADLPHNTVAGPEQIIEHRQALHDVLAALSDTERAALLAWMRGESAAEISARLGVTAPAAKQTVHRARKKARDTWAGAFYGGLSGSLLWRMRRWLDDHIVPSALSPTQLAVTNVLLLSMSVALVVGGSPGGSLGPDVAEAAPPLAMTLGPTLADVVDNPPTGVNSNEPAKPAASSGLVVRLPKSGAVPSGETCSPDEVPLDPACAGLGSSSGPGDTFYLKRFGPDGPHVTQPVVSSCDSLPDNNEVGCDSEEPPDGYQAELPPWPDRSPEESP